jgi:hypothetical protein
VSTQSEQSPWGQTPPAAGQGVAASAAADQLVDKGQSRLAQAWQREGGPQEALDPAFIQLLLSVALQLFQMCAKKNGTPQAVRNARNPGAFQRLRARQFLKQQINDEYGAGAWRQKDGDRIVSTVLRAGQETPDEELHQIAQLEL